MEQSVISVFELTEALNSKLRHLQILEPSFKMYKSEQSGHV